MLFEAGDRLYGTTDEKFRVVECRTCRLLRLYPRPEPTRLQQYYPETYWDIAKKESSSLIAEHCRRFALRDHVRFVEKALAKTDVEGPVLDVGCRGGLFLKILRERGHPGIGLDSSLRAATTAWEINRTPAVCATLCHAPLPDSSFAAVTMFHVLEHLYDPPSYLEAARRLLKPGGRLIIQVPNAASWQFLLLGENWRGLDVPRHLWSFRAAELETLLDRSGFEPVRTKHFSLRDNPVCLAASLAPSLDPAVRKVRLLVETPARKLVKDLSYFALVLASLPFALLEAACHAGGTVMVEARKKT